jgi:hypothetical protein
MLVSGVIVADETVTIRSSRKALAHAISAREEKQAGVLTFIQDWRARHELDGHSDHWKISVARPA